MMNRMPPTTLMIKDSRNNVSIKSIKLRFPSKEVEIYEISTVIPMMVRLMMYNASTSL